MMKLNKYLMSVGLVLVYTIARSQSEGLTSSPYSLYGLGTINQTSIGRSNGMGHTGIGLKTETEINNLNPSNFALIPQNSFFYDVGMVGEFNTYSNRGAMNPNPPLIFPIWHLPFESLIVWEPGCLLFPTAMWAIPWWG